MMMMGSEVPLSHLLPLVIEDDVHVQQGDDDDDGDDDDTPLPLKQSFGSSPVSHLLPLVIEDDVQQGFPFSSPFLDKNS